MDYTSSASMQNQYPGYYQYAVCSPQTQNPIPNYQQQQTSVYYATPNINPPVPVDPNLCSYSAADSGYGLSSYYPDPNAQSWATYSDPNAQNWTAQQQGSKPYGTAVIIPPSGTTQSVSKTTSVTAYPTTTYATTTYPTTTYATTTYPTTTYPTTANLTTAYPTTQRSVNNFKPAYNKTKTKTTQPMYCDVCKILCNTQEVFSTHRVGKKHKKNLEKLKVSLAPVQQQYAPLIGPQENPLSRKVTANGTSKLVCDVCKVVCDTLDIMNKHKLGRKHIKNTNTLQAQGNPSMPLEPNSLTCDVCNIVCNKELVLEQHFLGRKHRANVGKATAAAMQVSQLQQPPVTLAEPDEDAANGKRLRKNSAANSKEDLELKKRKLLESGTAPSAAKTCLLCNVVCNSDIVFSYHLHGARHNMLVRKIGSTTPIAV